MKPEEFDIDFDFDKAYGYDPDPGKDAADDDFDLDAALARELGPDFDALFEKEFAASQAALNAELGLFTEPETQDEEEDLDQARFFGRFAQFQDTPDDDEPGEAEPEEVPVPAEESAAEETPAGEPADDTDDGMDEIDKLFAASLAATAAASMAQEEDPEQEEVPPTPIRERRQTPKGPDLNALKEKLDLKAIGEKIDLNAAGEKFSAAGQVISDNAGKFVSALKDCKPGKMDKAQKRRFKNDVLPVLIGAAAFVLCMIFIFGSVGRALNSDERQQAALEESIAKAEAEAEAAALIQRVLSTAAAQAAGYDYQAAIATLDSYKDAETGRDLTDEMTAARAEYTAAMTGLVVWDDPSAITNLSFHVLIEDRDRAYSSSSYAGSYRKNFITTAEFSAILEQLYDNGYVLVNLDSFIAVNTDAEGNASYTVQPMYLPADKTPIMITETLVNYFAYMVDGDGDGEPDADGDGFASRLVISGGEIKAEYVDAGGQTQVGDYDLVPILNSFIDAHPDFSYRGAKAILAVTGEEGIFGWRTNEDETLADSVMDIAEVLRADGYQIACNSYANLNYGSTSLSEISSDISKWNQKIAPILGEVDILVLARGGSMDAPASVEDAGSRFSAIYDAGFHYVIGADDAPAGTLTSEFFCQDRLMVTGENLTSGAFSEYFASSGSAAAPD